jgi:glycosyltransferase involved in cell wall biosynthesis
LKFSIIVPVYNIENYLHECVNSILVQSFKSYEILLIDDGSTDKSATICDEFASSNNNIIAIHKKNGGLSDARNVGIEKAKGEYIIFIDGDDYIEEGTLEVFARELCKADDPDVMITRIKQVYKDAETKYMDEDMPVSIIKNGRKEDIVKWIFSSSNNTWPSVRYVVQRRLIETKKLKFPCGYLHEDIDWTARLFLKANSFTCCDFYWYNHRMKRRSSITSSDSAKRLIDVIELVVNNINNDEYLVLDEDLRTLIFSRLISSVFSSLRYYKYGDAEEKKKVVALLKHNYRLLYYSPAIRHRMFLAISRVFGFRVGLSMMGVIHK